MARIVALDSSPLMLLTARPGVTPIADRCRAWLEARVAAGDVVLLPGIVDYEVRRELLRRPAPARLAALDDLRAALAYVPVDDEVLDLAASLWARARNVGMPTASPDALDGDVILAAQARLATGPGDSLVIATSNPGHLARFADARDWETIT